MKKANIIHLCLLLLVAIFGLFYTVDLNKVLLFSDNAIDIYRDLRHEYTIEYSGLSMILFVFTAILGKLMKKEMMVIGLLLQIGGILTIFSAMFMFLIPIKIHINILYPLHCIWFVIAAILNILAITGWGKEINRQNWQDDILDV